MADMDWSTVSIRNGHLLIPKPGGGNLYFIAIPLWLILLAVMAFLFAVAFFAFLCSRGDKMWSG
jgi:hypothetical protein